MGQHRRNFNDPGHAHELTFSCYKRYPFLKTERTCVWLAESINLARSRFHFDLWAYVFMPEHVHLIVHPRSLSYDMAMIRQAIKEPVGRTALEWLEAHAPEWLPRLTVTTNTRTRRYFWLPGGGYDRNITEPETLQAMMEYIHLNPVRRGLVERAEDWKWSSAGWYIDQRSLPLMLDPIPPEWIN